ncbi:unnamed protein product [Pleuronectes platessa]|uniref:UBFD1 PH-like C-terminal domain-containing protein n=1 Tax=Pleuronectes platessa TaxID=8262 RepID=A0A9N7UNX0_PLEPL|nr:unnamed protein product [Pleuronectes platessa]
MATQDGSEEVIMETEAQPKEAEPPTEDAEKSEAETTSHSETGAATTQDSSISNGDDADDDREKHRSQTKREDPFTHRSYPGNAEGSTMTDVLAVTTPKEVIQEEVKAEENKKEPLCRQKQHRKVLDKGKPDDIMAAIKGTKERLPTVPLSGMFNKSGGKVRLTFKLEQDQLWLGTKERTEKVPMGSIKNVLTEPIEGHEDYHMMAFQLGPTEASQYWVYWVPVQFVDAIKDTVLGKWQYF